MLRESQDHKGKLGCLCPTSTIGQKLIYIRAHRVVGKVVFHAPNLLVSERFDQIDEREIIRINLAIRKIASVALKNHRGADMHGVAL